MASQHKLYARHSRKAMHAGEVSSPYRFETKEWKDKVLENALEYMKQLEEEAAPHLDQATVEQVFNEIPGLLPGLRQAAS